jgi:outer membrane receptor for Fe3+-dicitrate
MFNNSEMRYKLFDELKKFHPTEKISITIERNRCFLNINNNLVCSHINEFDMMLDYIEHLYKKKITSLYEELYNTKVKHIEICGNYTNKIFSSIYIIQIVIDNEIVYEEFLNNNNTHFDILSNYCNKLTKKLEKKQNNKDNLLPFLEEKQKTKETFVYNANIPEEIMKRFNLSKITFADQNFYMFTEN